MKKYIFEIVLIKETEKEIEELYRKINLNKFEIEQYNPPYFLDWSSQGLKNQYKQRLKLITKNKMTQKEIYIEINSIQSQPLNFFAWDY